MKNRATWIMVFPGLLLLSLVLGGCGRSGGTREAADDWFEPFDVPPMLTVYEDPAYPEWAKKRGLEGWVRVKVLVGSDGRVERVRVLRSSDPVFEPAALAAAKGFHFKPAERDRRPVRAAVLVPVWFKLGGAD